MSERKRLAAARRVFLDTAPVIYFVEANARYLPAVEDVFNRLDQGILEAVTSAVTLAECLIHPLRSGDQTLAASFVDLLSGGPNTLLFPLDAVCGRRAAELRAAQNLTLTDSLQLAAAATAGCDVFLTNDATLRRIATPHVVVLDDLLREGAGSP